MNDYKIKYSRYSTSIRFPKSTHRIIIQHGVIISEFDSTEFKIPNIFRRFFYWLLLGWRFEEIK